MRLSHTLVTNEAHSQLCVGVGLNDIYERYRLLWLSGTEKRTDGSGLGFRFRVKYVDYWDRGRNREWVERCILLSCGRLTFDEVATASSDAKTSLCACCRFLYELGKGLC